ncbi:mitochondrial fission factor homolog B isoform X4 [Pangasianodon hypophthalmus]|uniref:mitochondrial fission factor homolog B isoform X4 n=1 Tax=Pangasianodon hypophthalmus TaxID=310915 RepID=UPI00230738DC|nr:mitochondrial fission factor homolog B isoform X4 [Pangasianodon hypophthalmus]
MNPALEKMNGAAFPSPTAEMAEMNRIHYELQYTEGISQRMRVPEMLKVAPYTGEEKDGGAANPGHDPVLHTAMMQVPDRIIVTGDHEDTQFSRPRDLDLIQSTPLETLSLKTPPRVLTLNERPLDFLEMEQPSEEVRTQSRARRERSVSENAAVRHNGQVPRNDSSFALATLDTSMEGGEDLAVADATALRRQIIKLNRRLQLLEEENKERAKREMIMYSITVAFWLINSWVWLRR